jgi:iron(III) transport system substrate-binding protein
MKFSRTAALGCGLFFWLSLTAGHAAESKLAWQTEWEQAVESAKKEGQVTIYHTRGPFDKLFGDFSKRYPGIKIVSVVGRGGELLSRIMGERRAEKYLADLYLGSSGTPLDVFYPAKILEPISPILLLPEVNDPSNWFQKQHHYGDPEGKYIFVFEGIVRSDMAYSSSLVDPKDFRSYWDLLNPKWKGKIATIDPKLPGFPTGLLQFSYYHPDLGPKFLRQLFGEMDITLSREPRQLVDWLAVGKFAIGLAPSASEVESAMKQGLPVGRFEPGGSKRGFTCAPPKDRLAS